MGYRRLSRSPVTSRNHIIRFCFSPFSSQATLLPLLGLAPPLDLFLSLSVPELLLEFSAPPSVSPRCLLTSGFAGLTSSGLFLSCGDEESAIEFGDM